MQTCFGSPGMIVDGLKGNILKKVKVRRDPPFKCFPFVWNSSLRTKPQQWRYRVKRFLKEKIKPGSSDSAHQPFQADCLHCTLLRILMSRSFTLLKGLDDGVRVAMRVHLLLDEEMDLALPPRSHSSPVLGQVPSRDVS